MEIALYLFVTLFVLGVLTILHIPIAYALAFVVEKTYVFMRER